MANTIGPKIPTPSMPSTRTIAAVADAVSTTAASVAQSAISTDLGSTFDAVSTAADWVETSADELLEEKLEKLAPKVQNIGVAATALSAAVQSDASSRTGKVVNGAAAGVLTKVAAQALSTPVAVADMVLNVAGEKLVGEKMNKAAGGYITGHAISTPANLATAYFEAARGDTRALDKFSEKARGGDYGAIYQAAVNAGDYWADHGIVGGLKEAKSLLTREGLHAAAGLAKEKWQAARDFFKSP
jgi:hypothetical protein